MKPIDNFRDVFKTLKHKKPVPIFCPRCASPNLRLSSSWDYWLTPRNYVCSDCGYAGPLVLELEKESLEEEKEKG
jgi:hypothetical protein